eukprot:gene8396-14373_t
MEYETDDRPKHKSFSTEEKMCLEEICTSNGLDFSEKTIYKHIHEVELFLNGISAVPPMRQFPALKIFCLIGHQISKIEHLEPLVNLEELWICECSIKVLESLDRNRHLKKLYLYDNEIEKIENISHLKSLELLWLNGNKIEKIEGINTMESLKELNLSENLITKIGRSLESNQMIEILNLSGNPICSVKDITNLSYLPKLRSLSFKDPLYTPSPVGLLCNYALHVLYHLPALNTLDSLDVSVRSLKEMSEMTVSKKIMFYKMKLKTLEREYNETKKKLEDTKMKLQTVSFGIQKKLWFAVKEVERELEELNVPSKAMSFAVCETKERKSDCPEADKNSSRDDYSEDNDVDPAGYDSEESSSEDELEELLERVNARRDKLKTKLQTLLERIAFWDKRDESLDQSYKEVCLQARHFVDQQIARIVMELETAGNVRFEEGSSADPWYKAVHDVFMSRFTELDYRASIFVHLFRFLIPLELPITSVKIHQILRIYNRNLHMRFDSKLEQITDKEESVLSIRDENREMDYLFNVWDHSHADNSKDLLDKIENGYEYVRDFSVVANSNAAVHLTNSLGVADKSRIKYILKKNSDKDAEKQDFRYGIHLVTTMVLIITAMVPVFTTIAILVTRYSLLSVHCYYLYLLQLLLRINKQQYQNYDTAYQTRRHAICPTKARSKSTVGIAELCDCTLRRCTWHVFNAELVLPEYMVEFEYVTRNAEPLQAKLSEILLEGSKANSANPLIENATATDEKHADMDQNIINMDPMNSNAAVHLTNSLGVADKSRIKYILKKNSDKDAEKQDFRYGRILVCKTFLGKTCKVTKSDKKINKQQYQNYDTAYQTRRHAICPTKARSKSTVGIAELCDCTLRRCTWHVFNAELVLPEYMVEFEYVTRNAEPLQAKLSEILLEGSKANSANPLIENATATDEKHADMDQNIINMDPMVKTRPRLTILTEDLLLKHTGASYISRISTLNLNGSGLTKLKLLSTLSNLKKLIVSFNDLTSLQDLSGMSNLEYLDASFNKISSVDGFKGCIHLAHLDLSWNRLHYTREEVGLIRKYLPAIKTLNLKHNPFLKPETLRLRCIGRLRNLITLDNEEVAEEETTLAIRMAACSRIAYVTVLAHSRTDVCKPRTLSLESTCSVIMARSKHKPVKLYEDDKKWFYKGLESCPRIEELSLAGNCISKLEGIDHLLKLKSLNLDNNNLMSIDATNFEKLSELRHLSLENNSIARIKGLQKAVSLYDLFIGNNKITNMREIFHLKNIQSLAILDLIGNPITGESSDYRIFIIYHIQSLRALDGKAIDQMEETIAKDTYGGRLTQDFVAERLGHSNFVEVCELDLPSQGLRSIDLGNGESFSYLTSVNLEHNSLTNFGGLIHLSNLKVLCLNFNHIESIIGKAKGPQVPSSPSHSKVISELTSQEYNTPVLDTLEVLHLGFNGISSIPTLQLGRLRNLKTLFLQGNDITKVDGIEGLTELRELVLDKNKIKNFGEYSFASQWKLTELHCEENRLRELANLEHLSNLQRLFIGLNRIQESAEIERLERLSNLIELSVIGNPVSRRLMHRPMLVFRQPNLISIDGMPVTNEERTKAELYFLEQQGGVQLLQTLAGAANVSLPGINAASTKSTGQVPLKVTQVQLSGNNPDLAYQLGQRIYSLDRLQNTTPPPYLGSDNCDYSKGQKSGRRNQANGSRKSGGRQDNSNQEK